MLSDLLVKKSPSPTISRKRTIDTSQQEQFNTRSFKQESSFISSNNNKRYRPTQSQSLTRHDNYQHIRQYPKTLEIFVTYMNRLSFQC